MQIELAVWATVVTTEDLRYHPAVRTLKNPQVSHVWYGIVFDSEDDAVSFALVKINKAEQAANKVTEAWLCEAFCS